MSTKDWLEKDYYKVLGVSSDAKPDEIKKAFRKLARENATNGQRGTERTEWEAAHPQLTFQQYLRDNRGA